MKDLLLKLRKLRINLNYTQEYVAYCLGITQKAYSKIENGESQLTVERFIQLVTIFGISPQDFFQKLIQLEDSTFV
jgi:transcriptional regulator with XRE-family HTH domain